MQQLSPTSLRSMLAPLAIVALISLLLGMSLRPGSAPASTVAPLVSLAPSPSAVPQRTLTVDPAFTPFPPFVPTPAPCVSAETIPAPLAPVALPAVDGAQEVALAFSTYLYGRAANGDVFVRANPARDLAVGLWFVPPQSREPRLLAETETGMLIPLGLAPAGDVAVVWWLPASRATGQPACEAGVYFVDTATGAGQLVTRRDWTGPSDEDVILNDQVSTWWTDPRGSGDAGRTYRLPRAAISADGRFVALLGPEQVEIYMRGETIARYRHVGACPDWAWAPTRAVFVAGCDDMTTAWLVDADGGFSAVSVALPWLAAEGARNGWGTTRVETIGFTNGDRVRLAALYGYATGCEASPCSIPPPAYGVATIGSELLDATTTGGVVDFLAGDVIVLPTGSAWAYVDTYGGDDGDEARIVDLETGISARTRRLEVVAGAARNGSALYGWRVDDVASGVVIVAVQSNGNMRELASLSLPDGAMSEEPIIHVLGLLVAGDS